MHRLLHADKTIPTCGGQWPHDIAGKNVAQPLVIAYRRGFISMQQPQPANPALLLEPDSLAALTNL